MGVAYVCVSRHFKEEWAWAIDKWLVMLLKIVIPMYVCMYVHIMFVYMQLFMHICTCVNRYILMYYAGSFLFYIHCQIQYHCNGSV